MRRLTQAELNHLLDLLLDSQVNGSYYGNQVQYYKRTSRLIEWYREQLR